MTVYTLRVFCMACNRVPGETACDLCCRIEDAERGAGNGASPQLAVASKSRLREGAGKPSNVSGERERGGQRSQAHPPPREASSLA